MSFEDPYPPGVCIIVLNWNNAPDTIECINSIKRSHCEDYEIVLVDNGSTDDSLRVIRNEFPELRIIEIGTNMGYAGGNNVALRAVQDREYEFILILNNDTIVDEQLISEMLDFCNPKPDVGMACPLIYCLKPNDMVFAAGSNINWWDANIHHRWMFKSMDSSFPYHLPDQVDFAAGCGIFLRKSILEDIGFFQEEYYLNFEDVELGLMVKRAGYEVWYVPTARLWHKISSSLGIASPLNTYYMTRNCLLFFSRNSPPLMRPILAGIILLRTIRTILAWSLKPMYQNPEFQQRRCANLYAIRDFFLGRYGKMGEDVRKACCDQ